MRLVEGDLAAQMGEEPGHAMGAHRRQHRIEPAGLERAHLLDRAAVDHRDEAGVDAPAQRVALRRQEQAHARGLAEEPRPAAPLEGEERLPGRLHHLERALDAQAVARPEAQRRRRIAPRELGVERRAVAALGRGADALAHRLGHGRDVGEALDESLEIKARAADEDRQAARGARLRQHGCGIAKIVSDREVHRAVDMAVEPVRRLRLLLRRRSRGEDAQVAVDLHRIRVDDQAAEPRARGRARAPTCLRRSGLQ